MGKYRILGELGTGGMGCVYSAEDIETGRPVAIKVMKRSSPSVAETSRFLREGRLAASVNHPNLIYILSSEEHDESWMLVMERVDGGNLRDRLRREGTIAPDEAVRLALQILDGLGALAQVGVLHRDIKPSNCLMTSDGQVKVADFGLARSMEPSDARGAPLRGMGRALGWRELSGEPTSRTSASGTPAYASPEQMRGKPASIASDIYSFGATLYEMLLGRPPGQNPRPASDWPGHIDSKLVRIVLKCLHPDQRQRFQDYDELKRALLHQVNDLQGMAPLVLRFGAAYLDWVLIALVHAVFSPWTENPFLLVFGVFETVRSIPDQGILAGIAPGMSGAALGWVYFGMSDALLGASLGKRLMGLRVRDEEGRSVGFGRTFLRAAIFVSATVLLPLVVLPWVLSVGFTRIEPSETAALVIFGAILCLMASLFAPARRRNGWTGVHDLCSRSRVFRSLGEIPTEAVAPACLETTGASAEGGDGCLGPFRLERELWRRSDESLWLAEDPILRRMVWIFRRRSGIAGDDPARGDWKGVRRVRWIAGRKEESGEVWDAYEAVKGRSLMEWQNGRPEWGEVRRVQEQLAEEFAELEARSELPDWVSADRIWVTPKGRVLFLDFRAPGWCEGIEPFAAGFRCDTGGIQHFLAQIAGPVLRGDPAPPCELGFKFLRSLREQRFPSLCSILEALKSMRSVPASINRGWRVVSLLGGLAALILGLSAYQIVEDFIRADLGEGAAPDRSLFLSLTHVWSEVNGDSRLEKIGLTKADFDAYVRTMLPGEIHNWDVRKWLGAAQADPETDRCLTCVNAPLIDALVRYFRGTDSSGTQAGTAVEILRRVWDVMSRGGTLVCLAYLVEFGALAVARRSLLLELFGIGLVDRLGNSPARWRLLIWWSVSAVSTLVAIMAINRLAGPFLYVKGFQENIGTVICMIALVSLKVLMLAWAVYRPFQGVAERVSGTYLIAKNDSPSRPVSRREVEEKPADDFSGGGALGPLSLRLP